MHNAVGAGTADGTSVVAHAWSTGRRRGPSMIALLDGFRDTLEDLGGDLGATDPVSGDVVVELRH